MGRTWRLAGGICVALVVLVAFDSAYTSAPFAGRPYGLPLVSTLVAAASLVGLALGWPDSRRWLPALTAVAAGFSIAVSAVILTLRPSVNAAPFAETAGLLAYLLCGMRWLSGWIRVVCVGLTTLAAVLLPPRVLTMTPQTDLISILSSMMMWLLGAIIAALVGLYLRTQDNQRVRSLAALRHAQRLELARDLHDFVAHHVSGIVVQAQASQVVAQTDPALAVQALQKIEEAGTAALASLRRTVGMLREAPEEATLPHGLSDLPEMVERFSSTGKTVAVLTVEPDVDDRLPPEVTTSAYRIVLEALTNVRRHAPEASTVDIRLARSGGDLEVAVENDGVRAAEPARGGFGLIGLTERVEAVGGTLAAGPSAIGWRVAATLPVEDA
ncbi:sensor histidine kinase [Fodinicola acaciae]|uniref:sensor histidine kinase n=1 Tax=Fodinicola acaciae TaxID=2681555 RepID=UPI0013D85381|nr:histidine kinase [Fodinicola acaciae]